MHILVGGTALRLLRALRYNGYARKLSSLPSVTASRRELSVPNPLEPSHRVPEFLLAEVEEAEPEVRPISPAFARRSIAAVTDQINLAHEAGADVNEWLANWYQSSEAKGLRKGLHAGQGTTQPINPDSFKAEANTKLDLDYVAGMRDLGKSAPIELGVFSGAKRGHSKTMKSVLLSDKLPEAALVRFNDDVWYASPELIVTRSRLPSRELPRLLRLGSPL